MTMAASDYLNQYITGWTKGDAQTIVSTLAEDYQFDDPNAGTFTKQAMTEYVAGMWQVVEGIRGKTSDPLLEITETAITEDQGIITAWGWWTVPGTPLQGSALIKVGDQGVISERLCYYTKLPEG